MSHFDPKPILSVSMCFIKNIDELENQKSDIVTFSDDENKMPISLLEREMIENN